ncbi:sigma-70 family RNA polymerase sigma factor [Brevibacillus formosus]|uniref:RNA polymerase sigma factor n=1 Tax=Brevibacillus TaxID=55080 RepID=UPI0006F28E8B|nr:MULTISPECIES: sigma-70 family RNA polymerase sigma factor [Brevibacillus]MBW5471742.1 sigma-70 family RNA polymerase sigma factor [Brevibacillus formosus]RAT94141.1 RNA polymerase subunit sigma-70 [Brevibacillus sp. Leaf182]
MDRKLEKLLIRFITENKQNVYQLAFSYVKNADNALDIVQDSIHKALSSSQTLKSEGSLKAWFYRIVVNTSLDFLRKQKRIQLVDDKVLELHSPISEDAYHDIDLEKALEELPCAYRTVIILRYFEDLKIEEIAEVMNENISTIKTRLYQALRKLRIQMSDEILQEVK